MNKNIARKTARHEAGHLVMNWYLKRRPTRTEIFNEEEGLCHGTGELLRDDDAKLLWAAGYAAEFRNAPLVFEFASHGLIEKYVPGREAATDLGALWNLWGRYGAFTNRMIYNNCVSAYYEAEAILNRYKEHVDEVTGLLLNKQAVTETEGGELFRKWGMPEKVYPDFGRIQKHLVDLTEDLKNFCGK